MTKRARSGNPNIHDTIGITIDSGETVNRLKGEVIVKFQLYLSCMRYSLNKYVML